jgi:hypothetical protein
MINLFWSGLLALLLLSGCGWDGTASRPNDFASLTSIQIVATSPTIAAGTSTKLTVKGSYSGLFTRDVTDQAVWTSDTPAVADFITASSPNRVTGLAPGTANLKATVGGLSATYTLTVSNATVTAMTITPVAPPALPKGRSTQFVVSGTFSDSTTQDLTFDAVWSSTDTAVATVSNDPASKGLAKAEAATGSATISATIAPPAGVAGSNSGTVLLTVTVPALDAIAVTPANSSVVGFSKTVNFVATGRYSDGTTAVITTTATWSSSATGVATISASSGVATTVAAGTAIVTATLNGIIGSTNLTVTAPVLNANGLLISPAGPINLSAGTSQTQQLSVTATFSDGSTQNVSSTCGWTSTFPAIASVSTTGLVTAITAGTTLITATYGGQSVTVTIIVVQ